MNYVLWIYLISYNIARLVVIDTFFAIQKSESNVLLIYSTADCKLLTAIGNTGQNLNEFIFPTLIKQFNFYSHMHGKNRA